MYRHTAAEFSDDNFVTKSTLTLVFTASELTAAKIDGSTLPSGPSVSAMLDGLALTLAEFAADDADGDGDPVERQLQCPAGGPLCTRSADGNTIQLTVASGSAILPPFPKDRMWALLDLLESI